MRKPLERKLQRAAKMADDAADLSGVVHAAFDYRRAGIAAAIDHLDKAAACLREASSKA